eukprot:TRINITY_DN18222_c0_g1_i1.p4 TRINITY_DN18222_c0_g1~~TRINITY_DN18222_c0_g1_i1.p4  ORF type:complete len:211 (+),score=78.80 TRINITY_DN18222_c0_g1_i1:76-708(+)
MAAEGGEGAPLTLGELRALQLRRTVLLRALAADPGLAPSAAGLLCRVGSRDDTGAKCKRAACVHSAAPAADGRGAVVAVSPLERGWARAPRPVAAAALSDSPFTAGEHAELAAAGALPSMQPAARRRLAAAAERLRGRARGPRPRQQQQQQQQLLRQQRGGGAPPREAERAADSLRHVPGLWHEALRFEAKLASGPAPAAAAPAAAPEPE